MNVSSWKLKFGSLAATAVFLVTGGGASAAISFAASGGDLVITLDSPVSFLVTAGSTSSLFSLNFEDVYTTGSTDHHGDVPLSGSTTMSLPGGVVSDGLETWSDLGSTAGLLDPTDFYATYHFGFPQVVQAGDVVTVNPGVVVIAGFITAGGLVPDAPVTVIHLFDEGMNDLSSPVLIPEAPVSLLGGLGMLGLLKRRRR